MADERQRPEGRLIGTVIDASPTLTRRSVADAAGMSEARVRQIIKGYASAGRGQSVEVIAPAATLARIAIEVGLSPDDLARVGREDAAEQMRERLAASRGRGVVLDVDRYQQGLADLLAWTAGLDAESEGAIHPPQGALWLWTPRQLADNLAEQVAALEAADTEVTRKYFHQVAGRRRDEQGQEHSDGRDTPPMTPAGNDPAPDQQQPPVHGGASQVAAFTSEEGESLQAPDTPPPPGSPPPPPAAPRTGRRGSGPRAGT